MNLAIPDLDTWGIPGRRRASRRRITRGLNGEGLEARCLLATIPLPTIPNQTFNVTSFGAIGDGTRDNTTSIQAAINAASVAGGGIVEVPAAAAPYESGPLTLKSNINLQVDGGAILQMLPLGRYPLPGGATSYPNFLDATRMHDVEVSGSGTIDGQGLPWWTAFNNGTLRARRPQMITFNSCTTVLVQDVTLTNPPNTHLRTENTTSNVTIQRITINTPVSPNTDGIDLSGTNQLVTNCNISDGDDNVAIGASTATGTGPETAHITITNCAFGIGHGVSIGSLTSGWVQDVTVDHVSFTGTTNGIRLKSDRGNGGLVQNLSYSNITMTGVQFPIYITSYYPNEPADASADPGQPVNATTPSWQGVTISNLTAGYNGTIPTDSVAGIIWGLPEAPVGAVTLNNVNISAFRGMEVNHARNLAFGGNSSISVRTGTDLFSTTTRGLSYDVTKPYDATVVAAGFTDQDVGGPSVVGTSLYDPNTGNWSINGGGTGFGSTADQLNFASEGFDGAGTVVAKVNSLTSTGAGAEAGVMLRSSTTAGAAFAAVVVTPGQGVLFEARTSDGGPLSTTQVAGITAPAWVELIRNGGGVSAFYSTNGTNYTQFGPTIVVNLPPGTRAGLAVASGNSTGPSTATFSNVNITPTAIASFSVSWGSNGVAALETASDGLRLLPAGRNTDLPWLGITRFQVTLGQPGPLSAADVSVTGIAVADYGPVTISGSGSTYTITLARPIVAADRVTVSIGNANIASFTRRLDVLPGDVNDDGIVNIQDAVLIRNMDLGFGTAIVPPLMADINGDGVVDLNDYNATRRMTGSRLP